MSLAANLNEKHIQELGELPQGIKAAGGGGEGEEEGEEFARLLAIAAKDSQCHNPTVIRETDAKPYPTLPHPAPNTLVSAHPNISKEFQITTSHYEHHMP